VSRSKAEPELESGVAETVNDERIHERPPENAPQSAQNGRGEPMDGEAAPGATEADGPRYTARMTADEANEVRRRNDNADFLRREAQRRRDQIEAEAKDLAQIERAAGAAQRDLTALIRALIEKYGLSPDVGYQADPERAALIPMGPPPQQ
jgi:hypothetical protein